MAPVLPPLLSPLTASLFPLFPLLPPSLLPPCTSSPRVLQCHPNPLPDHDVTARPVEDPLPLTHRSCIPQALFPRPLCIFVAPPLVTALLLRCRTGGWSRILRTGAAPNPSRNPTRSIQLTHSPSSLPFPRGGRSSTPQFSRAAQSPRLSRSLRAVLRKQEEMNPEPRVGVTILPDGMRVEARPDGSTLAIRPDGLTVLTNPDKTQVRLAGEQGGEGRWWEPEASKSASFARGGKRK